MGWVVKATPRPFYPRERTCTHCMEGWVGLRDGLGWCGKSRPPLGFDPRTFHSVASRYTDWAIAALTLRIDVAQTHIYKLHGVTSSDILTVTAHYSKKTLMSEFHTRTTLQFLVWNNLPSWPRSWRHKRSFETSDELTQTNVVTYQKTWICISIFR
jgi:hypothetical protein